MFRDVVFYEHVFLYQRIEDTTNETDSPNIHDQSHFTEDQSVLSQPSQVIFSLYDNVENTNNNDHESEDQPILSQPSQVIFAPCDNVNSDHELYIQVPKEVCSHRDQNLNENHETT